MSAFLVSDEHIKLIAIQAHREDTLDLGVINKTCQVLWDANHLSLAARYEDHKIEGQAPGVSLNDVSRYNKHDAVSLIKQCQCFDYQACEWRGWDASAAKGLVDTVKDAACYRLPGYQDAKWGV